MKIVKALTFAVVVLSFIAAGASYGKLPDKLAIHWDAAGNPNGYAAKSPPAVYVFPAIIVCLVGLLYFLPSIDPLRSKSREFYDHYDLFILIFSLFMVSVQYQSLLWNLGSRINPFMIFSPGLAMLFYYSGVLMQFVKRNWFIGIRTPWTMSSDLVWEKTHNLGSKMFKACGVLALGGAIAPAYALLFILPPVLVTAVYLVVYSYLEYKKIG